MEVSMEQQKDMQSNLDVYKRQGYIDEADYITKIVIKIQEIS